MARKKKEQPKETTQGTSKQLPVEVSEQGSQNETDETQTKTPKQAMDELIAIDQELGLYTTTEAPTIALEEESTKTDTEVAITENVAVNESEEVLGGSVIITTELPEGYTQEEIDVLIEKDLDKWENREIGAQEEYVMVVEAPPAHFLFNGQNQPIPATMVVIREMRLQNLVDKVLYAANLGGELYPQGIRLDTAPFICKMIIPTDRLEAYNNLEGKLEYDETKEYLDVTIRAANSPTFIKRLIQVGKKGAVIAPSKTVSKVGGFSVSLKSLAPLEPSASVSVGVNKPIYSLEELKAMKSESLKIVSSWYKLPWQGSNHARILIRKAQEEK